MEGPRLCQVVPGWAMHTAHGPSNPYPSLQGYLARTAAFLQGKALGLQYQTLKVAKDFLLLLHPDVAGYPQSRQPAVFIPGPHAPEDTGNQIKWDAKPYFQNCPVEVQGNNSAL